MSTREPKGVSSRPDIGGAVVAVVVLVLSLRLSESPRRSGTIDWFGTFLSLCGLGCIMLGATASITHDFEIRDA